MNEEVTQLKSKNDEIPRRLIKPKREKMNNTMMNLMMTTHAMMMMMNVMMKRQENDNQDQEKPNQINQDNETKPKKNK